MEDRLIQRVHAAAVAAWWTILIVAIWLTLSWFAFLGLMSRRPEWVLCLWGGHDITWSTVQNMSLWFFGVLKLVLYLLIFIAIWLSLWCRGLRRVE